MWIYLALLTVHLEMVTMINFTSLYKYPLKYIIFKTKKLKVVLLPEVHFFGRYYIKIHIDQSDRLMYISHTC